MVEFKSTQSFQMDDLNATKITIHPTYITVQMHQTDNKFYSSTYKSYKHVWSSRTILSNAQRYFDTTI